VGIVFLSGHGDISTAVQVIKAGAEDLLTKPVQKDELLAVIEQALARGRKRKHEDDKLAGWRRLVSRLTPREQQVFERVVRGGLNKQIAFELGSTERTIKAHRQHVMQKLQIRSVAELVLMAEKQLPVEPHYNLGDRFGGRMRSRKLVLVVDDDRSMLRAVERLLTVRGYAVEAFSTVNSFIRSGKLGGAACLVLDINLNGVSGIELKRQLTRAGASLPTIFITAQQNDATRQAASDAGCIAYLTKPFASQDLVDAIQGCARTVVRPHP
jgi:FixJ family two-component response regulator